MASTRTSIAVASAFNLAANLAFPVLAIRALGASQDADALFIVFILPAVVTVLIGNSVLNWAAPRMVRRVDDRSRRSFAWGLLWVLLACVLLLCLLLWSGAQFAWPYLDPRGSYALAITVLPAGIVAVLAAVAAAVCQSLYTAERAVLASELRMLLANTLTLSAWFFIAPATLADCALLFVLRQAAIAVVLLPRLGRPQAPDLADRDLREVLRDSRVLLLAATYYKSEPFVDRLLFASVSTGAVAAFQLAHQVIATVTQLMNRVVTATLVAPLAERVHAGDGAGARRALARALRQMLAVGVVVWLVFLFAGEPLLRLLFAGAQPDAQHLALTAQMLVLLGGYLLAILLGQVLAQAFYTTGDTRTIMWMGIIGYTIGLALKLLALYWFGALGLAAALSLSWLLSLSFYGLLRPPLFRRPLRS